MNYPFLYYMIHHGMNYAICWCTVGKLRVQHEFTNKSLRYQPFLHHPQVGEASPEVSYGNCRNLVIQNWIQELDGAQKGLKIKVLGMASK
jgi:hypothetical protein